MLRRMSSTSVPYPLRMSEQLRARLKEQAQQNERSLHAEIIEILQGAVGQSRTVSPSIDTHALAAEIADLVADRLKR